MKSGRRHLTLFCSLLVLLVHHANVVYSADDLCQAFDTTTGVTDCSNKNLTSIPDGIDSGTEKLVLTGNNLTTISNNSFAALVNMTELDLSGNNIATIEADAFKGLTSLKMLHIHDNKLESLAGILGSDLAALTMLNASSNLITDISAGDLDNLDALQNLHLSYNNIASIDPLAFRNTTELIYLDLKNNSLSTLDNTLFATVNTTTLTINATNNLWNCTCSLQDTFSKLAVNQSTIICTYPIIKAGIPLSEKNCSTTTPKTTTTTIKPTLTTTTLKTATTTKPPAATTTTTTTIKPTLTTTTLKTATTTKPPAATTTTTQKVVTPTPTPHLSEDVVNDHNQTVKAGVPVLMTCAIAPNVTDDDQIAWFFNATLITDQQVANGSILTLEAFSNNTAGQYCCMNRTDSSATYCIQFLLADAPPSQSPPTPIPKKGITTASVVVIVLLCIAIVGGALSFVYKKWRSNKDGESYGLLNDQSAFRSSSDGHRGTDDFL